ncbi:Zinc finger RNA-binding protein [Eumeta japonica]|uniref:Zinc finger RNA-binding protein n=1 Tax=Eumeta variegata TaxID=151549 RepID=A0A4C1XE90_EUMVA|nr:Zinc finger RNA-binding protein [Eumeta japonica]
MEEEERAYWESGMEPWWPRGPVPPPHHMHPGMGMPPYGPPGRRPETSDDRHVVAKHAEIYPTEQELQDIQRAVSHTERALKSLSDSLADQARPKTQAAGKQPVKTEDMKIKEEKTEGKEDGRDNQLFSFAAEGENSSNGSSGAAESTSAPGGRALKGVMRVGLLAKGLLLKGDRDVRLVVLCHDRPTVTLLKRVAADLPHHLNKVKLLHKNENAGHLGHVPLNGIGENRKGRCQVNTAGGVELPIKAFPDDVDAWPGLRHDFLRLDYRSVSAFHRQSRCGAKNLFFSAVEAVRGPGDEPKYKVELLPAEGAVQVSDGNINVLVSLTSAVMREPTEGTDTKRDDKDVLPRQKCLDALAALRHAKWFQVHSPTISRVRTPGSEGAGAHEQCVMGTTLQARAATLQSCVIIIRIMRDLCRRIPNWTPLNPYAMELLVSGVMQSAGCALSPGEALRRVMEAVAGGLLLEHGPGLRDPCEKEVVDALGNLPPQKREDLTASAQQFLRQIAFRQIHKVLDMEPLPKAKHPNGPWKFPRKRRRSNTDTEGQCNIYLQLGLVNNYGEGKVVKTEEKMDMSEASVGAASVK